MADFIADLRDVKFALFDALDIKTLISKERFADFDEEDFGMVLDEAFKFARDTMGPTNEPGDRQGCTFEKGVVKVPEAYKLPNKLYAENGWLGFSADPEWGGSGMPEVVKVAANDMVFGANMSLALGMLLTPGAAGLIASFGREEDKKIYLEKLYSGQWMGTMCLTEAQAGSDVGASTTKAVKEGEHYKITGDKIFITYGDHDLAENIIHAVLARVEGAPKGSKGLSLFLVPKFRPKADGSVGESNDVACAGIEHKMGINGSPTCQMTFGNDDNCHGWLLGEEGGGMRCMFQMMNEARIDVGLQGSALANASYQAAWDYAKQRLQGPDIKEFKNPDAPRVPIARHPDVRQMLARQKAYSEGLRALVFFTAYCADRVHAATEDKERNTYQGLLDILTPVCKAYGSDMGFRVTEWALQTYGGYGYLKDYPAEQYMRDSKIASLYEGTNGIQAMDLIARKLPGRGGANVMALTQLLQGFAKENAGHAMLGPQVEAFQKACGEWGKVNGFLMKAAGKRDMLTPLLGATNYLYLVGDLVTSYFLLQQASVAWRMLEPLCKEAGVEATDTPAVMKLAEENAEVRFLHGKVKTAQFFVAHELPNLYAKAASVMSGDQSSMEMLWESDE